MCLFVRSFARWLFLLLCRGQKKHMPDVPAWCFAAWWNRVNAGVVFSQMLSSVCRSALVHAQIDRSAWRNVTLGSAEISGATSAKPERVIKPQQHAALITSYTHTHTLTVGCKLVGSQAGHGGAVPQIRRRPPAGFMLMTLLKRKSLQPVLGSSDCIDWIKEAPFSMKWISFTTQNLQLQERLQISVLLVKEWGDI